MADARLGQWLFLLACAVTLLKAAGVPVEITYVHSAIAKGAGEKLNANMLITVLFFYMFNLKIR